MNKDYFVWQACALKAASSAVHKECVSLIKERGISAEDKLIALRAMLGVQGRLEVDYHDSMRNVKQD